MSHASYLNQSLRTSVIPADIPQTVPPGTIALAVYCGSRIGNDPEYEAAAFAVGKWLGAQKAQLIYGGGRNGLMGIVAQAALESGAQVVGVIPKALIQLEQANTDCSELIVVDSMPERKIIIASRANAFLTLPGGIGTFEEIIEMWVQKQLGYHNKPLGFLNVCGYYDPFFAFIQHAIQKGFMAQQQLDLLKFATEPIELLQQLYPNDF